MSERPDGSGEQSAVGSALNSQSGPNQMEQLLAEARSDEAQHETTPEAAERTLPQPGQAVELTGDEAVVEKWLVLEVDPNTETFTAKREGDSVTKMFHVSQLELAQKDIEHVRQIAQPQGPIGDILTGPTSSPDDQPEPPRTDINKALNP